MNIIRLLALLPVFCLCFAGPAVAEEKDKSIVVATQAETARAIGHYAKARTYLIAAIREFDTARNHADPQVLIDVDAWRNTIIDRTEDLDRVLAPQPRASRDGVHFPADSTLLGEAR